MIYVAIGACVFAGLILASTAAALAYAVATDDGLKWTGVVVALLTVLVLLVVAGDYFHRAYKSAKKINAEVKVVRIVIDHDADVEVEVQD